MSPRRLSPWAAALLGAVLAAVGTAAVLHAQRGEEPVPAALATSGAGTSAALPATTPREPPPAQVPVAPVNPNGIVPVAAPNFRGIVQQYGPAVVHVTVEGLQKMDLPDGHPEVDDEPFSRFFRGLPGVGPRGRGAIPFRGQGSGFIVTDDGLILTNAHVVRDAKQVNVKLHDRREFKAKVLGMDPATDIAVLRIAVKDLPTVRLGDPRDVQVGDPVLAIGAPFGLEQTATQGIVSAKGRSLPSDAAVPFLQTDAAVNPGNSGGPLFDGAGNVIGINTQIYSQTGGYQGLSFAVPIDVALKIKDQIVQHGKVTHAQRGVQGQDWNQSMSEALGLPRPDGALVAGVANGSAASRAGLKRGDVITAVDGEPIVQSGQLSSRISLSSPGQQVTLTFWRDRSPREVSVRLGRAEERLARAP